jgi:hypothetical protein
LVMAPLSGTTSGSRRPHPATATSSHAAASSCSSRRASSGMLRAVGGAASAGLCCCWLALVQRRRHAPARINRAERAAQDWTAESLLFLKREGSFFFLNWNGRDLGVRVSESEPFVRARPSPGFVSSHWPVASGRRGHAGINRVVQGGG